MASRIRSLDFLPEIFQTPTNAQFLGATVDQLISQPILAPLQGYIGERFGPGIDPKDTYIPEPTKARTDYQLEPGVIFLKPDTNQVYDFISYPGITDAIKVEGGVTNDPQQLFKNQFYSWDPFVDLDKIVNFSQYYWLPNGPDAVTLTTNVLYGDLNYVVQSSPQGYIIDNDKNLNPQLTLIRGARYEFDVNQQSQFWIQGEPGLSGADPTQPNLNTRDILGVFNNGASKGKIIFDVPQKDAQDFLTALPGDYPVDLASDLKYEDFLDGYYEQPISNITRATPGVVTTTLQHGLYDGALVVFTEVGGMTQLNGRGYYANIIDDNSFSLYEDYDLTIPLNTGVFTAYTNGGIISTPNWKSSNQILSIDSVTSYADKTVLIWKGNFNLGVYKVVLVNSPSVPYSITGWSTTGNNGDVDGWGPNIGWDQIGFVSLVPVENPPPDFFKIVIQAGDIYAQREFYRLSNGTISLIPYISANKDILYYQDSIFPNNIGVIKLVDDNNNYKIDVVADILGKQQARVPQSDPTGIVLTNGLKVRFQGNVVPAAYLEGEYYVEGVGTSIELIPVELLDVTNEPFLIEDTLFQADYITINRASKDRNAWTRSNRWFHTKVIQTVEQANKTLIVAEGYDIKNQRAKRPIIEFRAGTKLFNQGIIGTNSVTWVDNTTTDALSNVAGQPFSTYHPDGPQSQLSVGDTIIFIADTDGAADKQFYVGNLNGTILLEPIYTYQINEQSYITNGTRSGNTYWYDGTIVNPWTLGQRKQVVNQEPFFDVFSSSGVSFSDTTVYPNSTFRGNKLFSYARGTGPADPILGFPLQYNGVGNLGDITFDVNLYSATFSYTSGTTVITENVSDGYVYDYTSLTDYTRLLGWQTAIEDSFQYQVFTFTTAATDYNYNLTSTRYICDIPAISDTATSWLNCAVYVQSKLQDVDSYTVAINPTGLIEGINTGAVVTNGGIGYTPNSTLALTFNIPEGGSNAQGTVTTDANGTITSVNITNGGFGYTFDSSGINALNTIPLITAVAGQKPTDSATFEFTLAAPLSQSTLITLNSQVLETSVVNILLSSNYVSENAFFEVPSNLSNNPFNNNITSINSGDIRLQYQSIYRNLPTATGELYGNNNVHDLGNVIPYGTNIIQSSSPLVLPGAFLRNSNHNIFPALKYNSLEYQKYKDLIVDNAARGNYTNLMTPASILDDIIQTIAATRNNLSPFFWSDMLPSGSTYLTNTYNFRTTTAVTRFTLSRVYDFNTANYYGVQVYLIRTVNSETLTKTLIRGRDYEVSSTSASLTVTYPILPGDQIQVDEYNQTYGSFAPSTPSKLGMYPKYIPAVVYDETYQPATWFIKGHDNSYNRLYGNYDVATQTLDDPRDIALLEFEYRVYNNIKLPPSYNQVDSLPVPLTSVIPGKFRNTGYTRKQIVDINTPQFLNWVGINRVNYQIQKYDAGNSYSYNYNQSTDKIDNELIPPGYWRGIYNYFYDTDHPNTAPWEMLGFTSQPSWWLDRYGEAPYTSDNTLLWNDLAQGIDWNNGNPVVLPARVRPGLLEIIPVDTAGNLIAPIDSVVGQYDYFTFKRDWVYGDQAPTETAYVRSSQWPFDAVRLLALTRPAQFFNLNVDVDSYNYNAEFNQYLYNDRYRLQPKDIPVYGSGTSTNSYINWIVDYEQQLGISATTEITNILNNLDVRLVYRLAGFSSKDKLAFYVEKSTPASSNNSLLIPDENYQIILYTNQPFDKIFYSSVIIQKVEGGFAVFGNGQVETYFKIVQPIFNGQYATFEQSGLSVTVTTNFNNKKITQIPYGYVFTTPQAVAEFLVSYGKYLETQGVKFEKTEGTAKINWEYMIYEFLYWVASGWSIGSTVNLNPSAKFFQVNKDSAIVQPLTIQQQNFVLNQNLLPVQNKDMIIQRDGINFAITPLNEGDTIAYTNLNVSNMEHAIIFDNETVFNDIIYSLNTGLRQQRLLLRGYKTGEWTGSVNPDGFILNRNNIQQWDPNKKYTKGVIVEYKNRYWVSNSIVPPSTEFNKDKWFVSDYTQVQEGLLANPSTRSAEATLYYDINNANLDQDASLLSYSLIGFRPREYLVAGNLPDSSQVNIYKNLIQNKGTSLQLNAFKFAQFPQSTIDYNTYENWAILSGQFGGVLNQNFVEIELNEDVLSGNPATIAVVNIKVSNITKASIAVVTTTKAHGLTDGQQLTLTDVLGMIEVNSTINNIKTYFAKTVGYSSTQFALYTKVNSMLVAVNSSNYTTYISGGYVNPKLNGVQQTVQLNQLANYGRQPLTTDYLPTIAPDQYNADTALPSAGYPNFKDVKYSAYNIASLSATSNGITALNKGNFIWIADDNGTWAMYTTEAAAALPILVVNNLDGSVSIYFNGAHKLVQNSTIAIVDYDDQVNGYYTVLNVLSDSTIQVTLNLDPSVQQIQSQGVVLKLTSQRVNTPANIAKLNLLNTEFLRNRVWVDEDIDTDWAVYEKTINYNNTTTLSNLPVAPTTSAAYTTSIGYLIGQGSINTITRYTLVNGTFVATQTFTNGVGFGNSLSAGTIIFVVGVASTSNVQVFKSINGTISTSPLQVLTSPDATSGFGTYVSISGDDNVIAIADSENYVYIFQANTAKTAYTYITGSKIDVISGMTDQFGYNMSFNYDGSRLIITSPIRTVDNKLESGQVYVFDRLGTDRTYTLSQTFTQPTGEGYEAADQGAEFGRGLAGNSSVSELLVGAPYALNQVDGNFLEGAVYRYTDLGKKTGAVKGTVTNFVDGTIYINGVSVYIFATTASDVAAAINTNIVSIPNVIASANGNILTISLINANNGQVNNKLTVTGNQSVLGQLNIQPYQLTQTIYDPHMENISQFGYTIAYNEQESFIVTAPAGNQFAQTLFDYTDDAIENDTIFDHDTTAFIDQNINGGAVYMFDYLGVPNTSLLNPGQYAYAQSINPAFVGFTGQDVKGSAAQGSALLFRNFSTVSGLANGAMLFNNVKQQTDWHTYRKSQAIVDSKKVVNVQLYDKLTNNSLAYIDIIDPLEGKILGIVAENIDYISITDPASYDVTISANASSLVWGEDHVGEIWVDTSNVRWVNYHQNDTDYNSIYFATVFPGSVVSAYTWTESLVTPDEWPGPGLPFSTINYSFQYVEDSTGGLSPRYYFWVSDSNTIYTQLGKTLNAKTIAQYIQDPLNSGIAYAGALNASTVALYNSGSNINDQNTILHIGLTVNELNDDLHQQFDLIRERSTFDFLSGLPSAFNDYAPPASLYSKFLDSLCGRDAMGNFVPDPNLPLLVRTGTARRPRQSMFRNLFAALENYITVANEVLYSIPVVEEKSASFLNATGSSLDSRTGRAFNTADYWQYATWWAKGYSASTKVLQEVSRYYQLQTLQAYEGLVAKVADNGQGVFEIYVYKDAAWKRIGLQNGTITILPSLYATTIPELIPSDAIYWILRALNEQIYTNNELIYRNTSLILMFEYIISEADDGQNYLPWLMKTSFLDVDHKIRDLIEYEKFQRDNEAFLEGYLNEIKPYHVVIKDFSLVFSKTETYPGNVTDFDLPSKYNSTLGQFYSPQLQYNNDEPLQFNQYYANDPIWQTSDYVEWFNNYGIGLLPNGLPNFPATKVTQYITAPVRTSTTQNYGQPTAAIKIADPTAVFIGQFITATSGAIPLDTQITSIDVTTGLISLTKLTLTGILTTDELVVYSAIQVENAYSLLGSGVIRIEAEEIAYQTIDRYSGIITGLTRGYNGTTATTHIAGVIVYQNLPSIQVYDGARGYSLALPPKITAYLDPKYPAPRQAVSLNPNINLAGTITSVDIVALGEGYAVQPLIEIEPPVDPALTQYFSLNDIIYNNNLAAGTNRNTIGIIVPLAGASDIPTVAVPATNVTTISLLNAVGITLGMGVVDADQTPNPAVTIPANTTVIRIVPATEGVPAQITFNYAVTLPKNTELIFVHQFRTGDPVRFKSTTGAQPPLGLLDEFYYYIGATGGVVTAINLTASGSNYVGIPNVNIVGGGGFGALAAATMTITNAEAITFVTRGTGYASGDRVEIRVDGQISAVLEVTEVVSGGITDFELINGGQYSVLPNSIAVVTSSNTPVYSITLINGGVNFTSKPLINLVLGGGAGAAARVDSMYLSDKIINNPGTGYSVDDILTIVGGVGTAATLRVTEVAVGGVIVSVDIEDQGSYTGLPAATGTTTTASPAGGLGATFNITFTIEAISLTSGGANYTSAPTVEFVGGGGSNAAARTALPTGATVTISDYSIYEIDIVADTVNVGIPIGGVDYTTVPDVIISGGGGAGAAALAVIDNGRPQSRIALFKNRADAFNNINRIQFIPDDRSSDLKVYRLAVTAILGSLFGGDTVREMTTNLLYDRVSFTTNITKWEPNTWYAGVYEDNQRLSSTPIGAATGLSCNLSGGAIIGNKVLILQNKTFNVQTASYDSTTGLVTATFVTGVSTELIAAASLSSVIVVAGVDNVYPGMYLSVAQNSLPGVNGTLIKVVSVDSGTNEVTLNQAITSPIGQIIGFRDEIIQNVGVGDWLSSGTDTTKVVVSVDNLVHNRTTIVYTNSVAPSDGSALSFVPNVLSLVDDDPTRIEEILVTGLGIQDGTQLTDYSYTTTPGYLTLSINNFITRDLTSADVIKLSTISAVLGSTAIASYEGVALSIITVALPVLPNEPTVITFNWKNPSNLNFPLRVAPGQLQGQRLAFYDVQQLNVPPIYYYVKVLNQVSTLPVNNTQVEIYLDEYFTQPVSTFNFNAGDIALVVTPLVFERSVASYNGKLYRCLESNNDSEFKVNKWEVITDNVSLTALDRIRAFYAATVNMPNNVTDLMTGLTYPNATFKGVKLVGDSSFGGSTVLNYSFLLVSNITTSNPGLVSLTTPYKNLPNGALDILVDGDFVILNAVAGMQEINDITFYVRTTGYPDTVFALYYDEALVEPVNTSSFNPYLSGGRVYTTNIIYNNQYSYTGNQSENPDNANWDIGGWAYNVPTETSFDALDTFLQSPVMSNTNATTYEVVGGNFTDGYSPEELVSGIVTDDVTIYVKTRPGSSWDPLQTFPPSNEKVDHTGYKVVTLLFNTSIDGTTFSFDNVTANPLSIDVFVSDNNELVRAYYDGDNLDQVDPSYPYTFTVDWQNKTVTIYKYENSAVNAFPANTQVQISVNEIGGGNQLIRTSTDYTPFAIDTTIPDSVLKLDIVYFDPQSPASSFAPAAAPADPYIPPVVYNNGNRILYRGLISTPTYNPIIGVIDHIIITNGGSGYTTAPDVSITGGGGLYSTASAYIRNGSVISVIITNNGSGYSSTPTITIAPPPSGVTATAVAYIAIPAVEIVQGGRLYNPIAGETSIVFDVPRTSYPSGEVIDGGRAATGIVNVSTISGSGSITSISITDPGYGYVAGTIEGFRLISGGSGYAFPPSVRLVNPGNETSTATATASITGTVFSIAVTNGGSGYSSPPQIIFTGGGGGAGATANAVLSGNITGFTNLVGGLGYSQGAVTFTFSGGNPTTPATVGSYVVDGLGTITNIVIGNPGVGYQSRPTLTISGANTAAASATPTFVGVVNSVVVVSPGTGYTRAPQVVFNNTGTGGDFATATATITGSVSSVTVQTQATYYTSAPIVIFDNTGTGGGGAIAVTQMTGLPSTYNGGIVISQPLSPVPSSERAQLVATRISDFADISLVVESIAVTNGGSGYTTAPTVTFSGGGDTALAGGTVATAILGNGINAPIDSVASIIVVSTGSGYVSAPNIIVSAPSGLGGVTAIATPTMASIAHLTYKFSSVNNLATVDFNRSIDTNNEFISVAAFGPQIAQSGIVELNSYSIPETEVFKVKAGQTSFSLKNYALQDNPNNAIVEINGRRISQVFYRVVVYNADGFQLGYPAPIAIPDVANLRDIWYQKLDGYIAVGESGVIITSRGGPNWQWNVQPAIGSSRPFNSVVSNFDSTSDSYKFAVAVGEGGQVCYNPNPFSSTISAWITSIDFPFSSDLINVSYDKVNQQFMALGAVDTVYTTGGGVLATSAYGFSQVITAGLVIIVNMTNSGSGYVTAPTVTFVGTGSGATGVAVIGGGSVIGVTITNPGSGYTTAPSVSFSGGGGSGASASTIVSTGTSLRWNSALAPALGWDDPGTGWDNPVEWDLGTPVFASASHRSKEAAGIENFTAIACAGGAVLLSQNPYDLDDSVYTIIVETNGSGYSATPTVTIVGGGGAGATATATVVAGEITGIVVVSGGGGYISNPTVVITDSTGVGATALASIDSRVWVYISGSYTGTTTDFTSIAYSEVDDYFMISGLNGELVRLTPGTTTVNKTIATVTGGYSFTVASVSGLTVGSRVMGGPIPTEVYCYVVAIDSGTNAVTVGRNPASASGGWIFTVGETITFGNSLTFTTETSGVTRDFTKIIWTDIYGPNSDPTTYPSRWAAIGPGGTLVERNTAAGITTWHTQGLSDISSNSITWDSDDNLYGIPGNFGLVWTWDGTTQTTVREFNPNDLLVTVNGNEQIYGVDWVINLNPVYYKTLFDGEYAGSRGYFNCTPFDATSVWIIFNQISKPAANSTVKIVYQSPSPTYVISGQTLIMYQQLQPGDFLGVTTFNYTNEQSLYTDYFTGEQVSAIAGINRFSTPVVVSTGTGKIIGGSISDAGFNYDGPAGTVLTGIINSTSGGTGASATVTLATTGNVRDIVISPGGSGYTSPPTVIFGSPPSGGVLAQGTATISAGQVTGIIITNPGSGYVTAPSITFDNTGSGGAGAGATCQLGYSVDPTSLVIVDGGQGYSPSTISVTWDGAGIPDRQASVNWNIAGDVHNLVNGARVRIEGVRGATELNSSYPGNNGYYVEVLDIYSVALYYDSQKTSPVIGSSLELYTGGGYIWNYGVFTLTQPLWTLSNPDRLWVTVNGARIVSENLYIYLNNEIAILDSFDANTEILVTSMTPYNTPGQMNFSIQLKTDIDSKYNLYMIGAEIVTPSSADWGSNPSLIIVEIEDPNLLGGVPPTATVTLGNPTDPLEAGRIKSINISSTGVGTGYTFTPKIRISGPGTIAPQCRAVMQQQPTVLGIVRRDNPISQTWLTQPLTDIDTTIYVQNAARVVESYELDQIAATYSFTNRFTTTTQTVYGIKLPNTDYAIFNGAELIDQTTGQVLTSDDYVLAAIGTNWYLAFPNNSRNGHRIVGNIKIGNVIEINGEHIRFDTIDLVNNTLTNLTRGYQNSVPAFYHPLHSEVQSFLPKNVMPIEYYTSAWNEDDWGPLQTAETAPANFLKRDVN